MERIKLPDNYAFYLNDKGWWLYTGGGSVGFLREEEAREFAAAMNAKAARIERLEKALTTIWENGGGYDREGNEALTNDALIAKKALKDA